ncbi:hypothetical protein BKA61DRAFT_581921 [Leptodontidium sp. MPI-SDFR-AT-0119]|nr:hypothetical protein BKA61DRAFT_581921 [Leptodontidium sp. MPI-SDFR-AT-0119]
MTGLAARIGVTNNLIPQLNFSINLSSTSVPGPKTLLLTAETSVDLLARYAPTSTQAVLLGICFFFITEQLGGGARTALQNQTREAQLVFLLCLTFSISVLTLVLSLILQILKIEEVDTEIEGSELGNSNNKGGDSNSSGKGAGQEELVEEDPFAEEELIEEDSFKEEDKVNINDLKEFTII